MVDHEQAREAAPKSDRTRAAIRGGAQSCSPTRATSGRPCARSPRRAAIDPAMVIRYFGSKEALFARVGRCRSAAAGPGRDRARLASARRWSAHFLAIWEGEGGGGMPVLLRSAASNDAAAERLREVFARPGAAGARRAPAARETAARAPGWSPASCSGSRSAATS